MKIRLCLLAAALWVPSSVEGQIPTDVVVRVSAHDAKLIGSGVGGARVTIREVATGRVLAEGLHQGSTGETSLIMGPQERGARVYDTEGAGAFRATLSLSAPTVVEISAEGPLGASWATQRASQTLLLVPGKHVVGEGIRLELWGFTVEIQAPTPESTRAGETIPLQARVTMLCGCPTEPGGLWDADHYEIVARLSAAGAVVTETPLSFSGTTSVYRGQLQAPGPGAYQLQILAMDPARGNFGIVERAFTVHP